ncbi:unnamed protein product, partial [Mesorhabditis belari]|uniref:Helicase ATP-binding domain-containing protein n=1 Tax=Mesorhabditis belari TaxID=2138241 RepID=A0AAF3EM86_9BILA
MNHRVFPSTSAVHQQSAQHREHEVDVEGIAISFLFQPYPQQIDYMRSVIRALNMKHDAVLESPTGTGKTLSLLCSTLAWLRSNQMKVTLNDVAGMETGPTIAKRNGQARKIFYCSRTHSQLAQVVSELNRTIYKDVRCAVLGGREQLCTNDLVTRLKDSTKMTAACHSFRKKHSCFVYNKWDKTSIEELDTIYYSNGAPDIEDMAKIARMNSHCAYYRSRQMAEHASLVFLPYNYLLDPNMRKKHKIDLNNSIVIFDEAHNIVNVCEESASSSITTTQISQAIAELKKAIEKQQEVDELVRAESDAMTEGFGMLGDKKKKDEVLDTKVAFVLLQNLFNLEDSIEGFYKKGSKVPNWDAERTPKTIREVRILDGIALIEMLEAAGFSGKSIICTQLDKIVLLVANLLEEDQTKLEKEVGRQLDAVASFIESALEGTAEVMAQGGDRMANFKFWINVEKQHDVTKQVEEYSLHWGCFDSSITMRRLKRLGARSIILTSGTLAPLESFASEMSLNVGDLFTAEHAAKAEQVRCFIVPRGRADAYFGTRDDVPLLGTFENRNNPDYVNSIGRAVLDTVKAVPQGVLVFFPSFVYMEACRKIWEKSGWLAEIDAVKKVAIEPKNKMQMKEQTMLFNQHIDSANGAVFFAVAKGKLSEGINFSDRHARAVIIIGIPFPPLYDIRIMVKRKILANKYTIEAMRTVNQAVGRVLRHKDDFGIVVLLDARFRSMNRTFFPGWLRSEKKIVNNYDEWINDMKHFFTKHGLSMKSSEQSSVYKHVVENPNRFRRRSPIKIQQEPQNDLDLGLFSCAPKPVEEKAKPSTSLDSALSQEGEQNVGASSSELTRIRLLTSNKRRITVAESDQNGQAVIPKKPALATRQFSSNYFADEETVKTIQKPNPARLHSAIKLTSGDETANDKPMASSSAVQASTVQMKVHPLVKQFTKMVKERGLKEEFQRRLLAAKRIPSEVVRAAYEVFLPTNRDLYSACKVAFQHMNNDSIEATDWEKIEKEKMRR